MEQCVNDEISSNNLIGAGFKEKYCVLKVLQDENLGNGYMMGMVGLFSASDRYG